MPLYGLQRSNLRQNCRSALEWGYPYSNFFLGGRGDVVGYTFRNQVLRLGSRVAIKLNFQPFIRLYTSPNETFEYSYPLIYMYYFYLQAKSLAEPFAYEEYRRSKIREKIEQERANRVRLKVRELKSLFLFSFKNKIFSSHLQI